MLTFRPVPRKCKRHDGWTPDRQRAFIEALADCASVKHAAHSVGMSSEGAYHLRRQRGAEEFAAAWAAALDCGIQRLEDIALERAIHGVEVPVYSGGKQIGTRTVHNDRLLMFMLRNRAADRFAAGASGKRLPAMPRQPTPEEDAELLAKIEAEMDKTHERLGPYVTLDALDTIQYRKWLTAHREKRLVILPETPEGEETTDEDPFPLKYPDWKNPYD